MRPMLRFDTYTYTLHLHPSQPKKFLDRETALPLSLPIIDPADETKGKVK